MKNPGWGLAVGVVAVTDDLFIGARILETARRLRVPLTLLGWGEDLPERFRRLAPALALLDLTADSAEALQIIRRLKDDPASGRIVLVGFLPHVLQDRKLAAEAAGCDRVLARSAFSSQLPDLLRPHGEAV
ncbi:MAG: response regulator [candidate division NC10 bacterium]|nr:response regulator [candidate division NC10 bacterium]